jgi:hypothetical protein
VPDAFDEEEALAVVEMLLLEVAVLELAAAVFYIVELEFRQCFGGF